MALPERRREGRKGTDFQIHWMVRLRQPIGQVDMYRFSFFQRTERSSGTKKRLARYQSRGQGCSILQSMAQDRGSKTFSIRSGMGVFQGDPQ